MEKSEKILDEVATTIIKVYSGIMGDLYARRSVSLRRSVLYKAQLLTAIQLIEKLELLAAAHNKPNKD
jgi:hypothetical protein